MQASLGVFVFGLVLVFAFPSMAWSAPASFASIPDYLGHGQFVQGAAISADRSCAYIAKQNLSSACNVQRIDLSTKKSVRLQLSYAGAKAMAHANGLCCVKIGNTEYLLVAPSNKSRYIAVFVISGTKLNYQGKISVSKKVLKNVSGVAVLETSGNKVTALISSAGKLRKG